MRSHIIGQNRATFRSILRLFFTDNIRTHRSYSGEDLCHPNPSITRSSFWGLFLMTDTCVFLGLFLMTDMCVFWGLFLMTDLYVVFLGAGSLALACSKLLFVLVVLLLAQGWTILRAEVREAG